MKTCTRCKIEKDNIEFAFKDKMNGKLQSACKLCQRQYNKNHYNNNLQVYRDRAKITNTAYRKRNRIFISEYKASLGCANCGEKEPCVLDFHHVDEKYENVSTMAGCTGSIERLQQEIKKCIILCSNCHRRLHAGKLQLSPTG